MAVRESSTPTGEVDLAEYERVREEYEKGNKKEKKNSFHAAVLL